MSPLCSVAHLWELRGSFGFVPHVIQHRANKKIKKAAVSYSVSLHCCRDSSADAAAPVITSPRAEVSRWGPPSSGLQPWEFV